ncbi:hypothetical protein BN1723_004643 [Verticillium longisporum]|uniref:Uncharacterized protein n=1 Tax=Verticillium longisporum TaxID=100787 RepID=A0A0G4MZX3_VERLO|nr:hypothetical protein BN1723_004643 [Verticillium longisporum]
MLDTRRRDRPQRKWASSRPSLQAPTGPAAAQGQAQRRLPAGSYGRKVLFFLSPHGPTRLRRTGHQPQQRQGGTRSLEGFWLRDARCVMCDARCALRNCVGVIAYPRDCATTQMGKLPPVTPGTHRPGSGPRTNATAPTVHYKEVYVYL